jgi:hypothetical protein
MFDEDTELYSAKTRDKYRLPTSSTFNINLNSLINKNIIVKQGFQYKLVNPIFREWLKNLDKQLRFQFSDLHFKKTVTNIPCKRKKISGSLKKSK